MTTLNVLAEETLNDHLLTSSVPRRNTLAAAVDDSETTVQLTNAEPHLAAGDRLSIGFEDCYVVSYSSNGNTATVIRGQFGSTAVAHALNDIIIINPEFPHSTILRQFNRELASLSGEGLFQEKTFTFTFNSSIFAYNFPSYAASDYLRLIDIRVEARGPSKLWPQIPGEILTGMPAEDFTDGACVELSAPGISGRPVLVRYRAGFTELATDDGDNDVATVSGLSPEAEAILPVGAAIRIISGREIKRTRPDIQTNTRRQEEVPVGGSLQSVASLVKIRKEMINQERRRLNRHPTYL